LSGSSDLRDAGRSRFRLDGRVGGVTILLVFLVLTFLPLGEPVRLLLFDGYQNLWPRERRSAPAVIVEIDEATLATYGQWPWPRTLLAELVDKVGAAGPAAIALDLILAEPDRYSPGEYARSAKLPEPLSQALRGLPDNDSVLARSVAAHDVVLGIAGLEGTDRRFPGPPTVVPVLTAAGFEPTLRRFAGVLQSRGVIDRAAAGRGLVSVDTRDRIARQIPLVANVAGVTVPALALELLRVGTRQRAFRLSERASGLLQVSFGTVDVPTQPDGTAWLYFSRHAPQRFVSANDILAGRVDVETLRGKLVLIGVTGLALVDHVGTPLREEIPGVELHAQLIEQIFDGSYLVRPAFALWLERAIMIIAGLLLILWMPRLRAREAVFVAGLVLAIVVLAGVLAFHAAGVLLDVATPALATIAVFIVMLAATLEAAERQRGALRDAATRVAGELEAARRIQSGLLAVPSVQFRNETAFELDAFLEPAQSVGGDFFECIKLDQRRLLFAVGDVSGKGVPAALFMALTKAILKATALRADGDVSGIVGRAASEIARENPETMFVTLFVGILDLVTGTIEYCNAGHEPPFVSGAGQALERFPIAEGPPLCVVEDFAYETRYRDLAPGQWVCVLTDGVTEAMNSRGELFGVARVVEALKSIPEGAGVGRILRQVQERVGAYVGDAAVADDLTLLVLRWNGPISAVPVEDDEAELADVDLDAPVAGLGDTVGRAH
jgi:serine phosphatase RsbU (regulator of sigma subunit)/CHASE2 domain-containing sensor protein